jgi:lactoylglutathione lyase
LDPLSAQSFQATYLGLDVIGFNIEMHATWMVHLLNFDMQAVMCIVETPVYLAFSARKLPLRHAERAAPKPGGRRQIIRPAVDDESAQFAFMHRFLQILLCHSEAIIMKYLHTMVRVTDIEQSLRFYRDALGLVVLSRRDYPQGRYTLVFLAAPGDELAQVELTHNWDPEAYGSGRNFGHLAYDVEDIYATCRRLMDHGVTINRPPRDGRMAFVRSPDNISIELLQRGAARPPAEPWTTMPNSGVW